MKKRYLFFFTLLVVVVTSGCNGKNSIKKNDQVDLTISAAASLQDVLQEIKAGFEKEHPNVHINYNFGASGALQQQIKQGAPVDLFFSAAEDKFDQLVKEGYIEEKNGKDLIGNELVLVVPKNAKNGIQSFQDLPKAERVSIGIPESVPAGKYAKETMENLNIWKQIEPIVVYAKDVRQVLTYVETGNVDAGVVYKTDALTSQKVVIVEAAKEELHAPIIYPAGVIKNSSYSKEARLFFGYLQSKQALEILKRNGFSELKQ